MEKENNQDNQGINYLGILKEAFGLSWKNKYLWWFGFFLALSNLGGMNFYSGDFKSSENEIFAFFSDNLEWLLFGVILFLAVWIFLFVLGAIGRSSLIGSIESRLKDKKDNFSSGLKKGGKNFWKIFTLSLIFGMFIFASAAVLSAPVIFLFLNGNYIIGTLMALVALVIFFPLLALCFFIKKYAQLYAVLGKIGIWDSIENGYNLFLKNAWKSFLMAIFLLPIVLILMGAVFSIFFFLGLIFLLLIFIFLKSLTIIGFSGSSSPAFFLIFIFFVPFFLVIRSFYEVFSQTVWILFFNEIAKVKKEKMIEEKELEVVSEAKPVTAIELETKN